MLERIAIGWGVALVVVGALGFVPAVAPMGVAGHSALFGVFAVNAAHNVVHVLSGLFALAVGFTSESASRIRLACSSSPRCRRSPLDTSDPFTPAIVHRALTMSFRPKGDAKRPFPAANQSARRMSSRHITPAA